MSLTQRLSAALDLRPGEVQPVLILWLRSFFMGATVVFSYTAANALFLSNFEATTLPYVYIASAVIIAGTGFLYSKLEEYFPATTIFIFILVSLILSILGIRAGLVFWGAGWLTFAAMIWFRLMMTLTSLEFWGLTGRIFTLRQGKRLFGKIGSGEVASRIIGYFSISVLIVSIGTANLLILAAISLFASLLLLIYLIRILGLGSEERQGTRSSPAKQKQLPEPSPSLLKDRYVLAIFAISMLAILGYYVLDFGFFSQTKIRYQDADELALFISLFFGVIYVFSLLFRTLLTGPILQKFGVRVGLLILPFTILVGAVVIVGTEMISTVGVLFLVFAVTKLLDEMLRVAIQKPSVLLLYQPFAPNKRLTTQVAAESIVEPIAIGLAGLMLLVFSSMPGFTPLYLGLLLAALALVWIVVTVLTNHAYPKVLLNALASRRLRGETATLTDEAGIQVLTQQIHNPDPAVAVYCLRLLAEMKHDSLEDLSMQALAHPAADVRIYALNIIEEQGFIALLPEVRERLMQDDTLAVRSTALQVLTAVGEEDAVAEVSTYLHHDTPQMRLGAMAGLLRSGGIEGVLTAGQALLQIVDSPEPRDRIQAAKVLQAVKISSFYQPLQQFLNDSDIEVRRAALRTAAVLNQPKLWPAILTQLHRPATQALAVNALARSGPAVLPLLDAEFDNPDAGSQYRRRLAQTCGQIQSDETIAVLRDRIGFDDTDARSFIIRALRRIGYTAKQEDEILVYQQIQAEIAETATSLATKRDLGESTELLLLQEALNIDIAQHEARLFDLLGFLYDATAIRRVQENLYHPVADKRAYALEAIDVMLAQKHKRLILPLFAEGTAEQRIDALETHFPQSSLGREERIQSILSEDTHFNDWAKACALEVIGRLCLTDCRPGVIEASKTTNKLLSETANWTLTQLDASTMSEIDHRGVEAMLLTIEKVIILKTVGIFSGTPDDLLAEIANLLWEVEVKAGETIFEKGDIGDSMYIIVHGLVDVHDQGRTLNKLGDREVFGEMALLDAEPRMASITALEDTLLLRLDQEPFYELMDDRIEVARGIIRVLLQRLRARVRDINALRAQLNEVSAHS